MVKCKHSWFGVHTQILFNMANHDTSPFNDAINKAEFIFLIKTTKAKLTWLWIGSCLKFLKAIRDVWTTNLWTLKSKCTLKQTGELWVPVRNEAALFAFIPQGTDDITQRQKPTIDADA